MDLGDERAVTSPAVGEPASVERIRLDIVVVPLPESIPHAFLGARSQMVCATCRVTATDGATGVGYVFAQDERVLRSLLDVADVLARDVVLGTALDDIEATYARCRSFLMELLFEGAAGIAIALLDFALWDARARAVGVPLHRLLDPTGSGRIGCYASDGLWRHRTDAELVEEAARFVAAGHTAMKMRVGLRPVAEDVARVRLVRDAVGPDVKLFADAIFALTEDDAITLAGRVEGILDWLEDPVAEHRLPSIRRIRDASPVPIASGERMSRPTDVDALIAADAVDIALLDLMHLGGVTPTLAAARALGDHGLPLGSHALPEFSAHLLAASPGGWMAEHFTWFDPLFTEPVVPVGGELVLRDRPGIGLELDPDRLAAASHRVDIH